MGCYLAGVDAGTSGARCSLFDLSGKLVGSAGREYGAIYPQAGWVEQDPRLLMDKTMEACRAAVDQCGIRPEEIASIGFSAQRSVTCPIDRQGVPVRPLISWQDARTAVQVRQLEQIIDAAEFYRTSGLPPGTTWILTKLLWMRENEPELYCRVAKFVQHQDLVLRAFGADDDYTDIGCMAFYGTWDVGRLDWNYDLLERLGLSAARFGRPTPAGTRVANVGPSVAENSGFAVGTPVCVGAGDQNCSVLGMGAIRAGMGTVTLGTAGLAILCVERPVSGFGGMMITNHAVPGRWEIEGLSNAAASSLRWFRDVLGRGEGEASGAEGYRALDALAATAPPGANGLLYLPYLATAGTPHWNPDARAAFIGLSFAHGRSELIRAVLEGVALEIREIVQQWVQAGIPVEVLRVGGGATRSPLWCQILADVLGYPLETLACEDSTGLGSALLGGVGAGVFSSIEEGVQAMVRPCRVIEPQAARQAVYDELFAAYLGAYAGLDQSGTFAAVTRMQCGQGEIPPID